MSDDAELIVTPAVESVSDVPETAEAVFRSLEDRVEVGSKIDRTPRGWSVQLMYGGARKLFGEGRTIEEAVTAAGA